MENTIKIDGLSDELLGEIEKIISVPTLLFNETEVLYLNESCKKMLGYEKGECLNREALLLDNFFDNLQFFEYVYDIIGKSSTFNRQEIKMLGKNKEKIWAEYTGKFVNYHAQKCILAQLIDITDKKDTQFKLYRISKLRNLMLEVTRSILETGDMEHMFELILKNSIKAFQKAWLGTILIKEGDELTVAASIGFGEYIKDFRLPFSQSLFAKCTNGQLKQIANIGNVNLYDDDYSFITDFGEKKFIKSTLTAPIYINESLFGTINIDSVESNAFDEDDVKTMEFIRSNIEIAISNHISYREKAFLANYDSLTGLYNRYYFEESFIRIKDKARRYKDDFKLVVFDIDMLKKVNDQLGHLAGDQVIKKIAGELKKVIRKSDLLARLGGDEFIGIFFHTDVEKLNEKFQQILNSLEKEEMQIGNKNVICAFSYGISSFPEESEQLEDLIKIADTRMYEFKKRKKQERT